MQQKLLRGILFLNLLFLYNFSFAQSVFINEFHYDNAGTDEGEAIEIAGPAGTNLSEYSIVLYNGGNNSTYGTFQLSGSLPDQQNGFGTYVLNFPVNGLQNGAPDGFALVHGNDVIQFLSYEGSFTAANGPAAGMTSIDVGVAEDGNTPIGFSLQLIGEGQDYTQFTWQAEAQNSFGAINDGQSFGGESVDPQPEPEPEPEPQPEPTGEIVVFINEIHYDNAGADVDEAVEIAGTAGTDLSGYSLIFYNGSPTQLKSYKTQNLQGIIPNLQNGYGTLNFLVSGIQNGDPDGIALIDEEGELIQFLSYGGVFTPVDGPAAGIESQDIGVTQNSSTPIGFSLQLTGEGSYYEDFSWSIEMANTYGEVNTNQTFLSPEPVLFINEFHYDTVGADTGEGIEVAGTAGLDLAGYSILFYNGANGAVYKILDLEGVLPNLQNGYGTLDFQVAGIQNGAPDGFALVKGDEVLQFLSYEGVMTATSGTAAGMTSEDVGVQENGVNQGYSLQLGGAGFTYEDFSWQEAQTNTFGAVNTNQSFGQAVVEPEPEPEPTEPGTIAFARAAALGEKIIIEGTLTATDHFGNTAFIQDETAGIAIFGNLVTGAGLYEIGDRLRITGTRAAFNDLVQVSDLEEVEYLGKAEQLIEPIEISLAELADYPGQLVKIKEVIFPKPGQLFFGNSNYLVTDGSGEQAELRINASVESLVGKLQPEGVCAEVVGVVGRYRETFQLQPRNDIDLPCAEEYNPEFPGSDISKEITFDAVTWNIEWFGDEANSPAARRENSDEVQKEAVKAVLSQLDADIIAVQEISDEILFAQMISEMPGYDFVLSEATSYPDSPGGQKLGFIYKTESVEVTNSRAMMTSVHPFYDGDGSLLQDYPDSPDRFFASGRLPFLLEANVIIDGHSEEMKFVALHARANGSSGAQSRYDMRKFDVEVLKDSLDTYYPNDKLMILGDYNDDVDYTVANVSTTLSTFESYVNDAENYWVLSSSLSEQGYRSYAIGDYDDMIDHIMVSDELFTNYIEESARVHYEFYNSDFIYTTSDHFPVSVRLKHKPMKFDEVIVNSEICEDSALGSASVEVSGGIAPYTYQWSNGQDAATASSLEPGIYSLSVSDYFGEMITTEIEIEEAETLILEFEDQKLYSGYGSNCTTLSPLIVSGGKAPYSYSWSTGESSEEISVCPSQTTTYSLQVTDANGCSIEASINIEVEDVSCGNGKGASKVSVCFKGKQLCIAESAVDQFLNRGAVLGSCETTSSFSEVHLAPNPAKNHSYIYFESLDAYNGELVIYNLSGIKLSSQPAVISPGSNKLYLDLNGLTRGVYLVKIETGENSSEALKLLKI